MFGSSDDALFGCQRFKSFPKLSSHSSDDSQARRNPAMARKLLFDLQHINLDQVQFSRAEIRAVNPQRFEFEQLSAIVHLDLEREQIVGLHDVTDEEFWIRGHIPGDPLLPAVLMLEASAQLCSFYSHHAIDCAGFYGFGGIDKARFRDTVRPGDRLFLLAQPKVLRPTRSVFLTQGIVAGAVVCEAEILGVRLPSIGAGESASD